MIPHQFFYLMVVLGLLWIFFMLHLAWPSPCPATPQRPAEPILPRRPRCSEPTESRLKAGTGLERPGAIHSGGTLALQREKWRCRAVPATFRIPVAVSDAPPNTGRFAPRRATG